LKIQVNPIKTGFVTVKESKGYKEACERCPFALQKSMYWLADHEILLHTLSSIALWFYISRKRKEQPLQWICQFLALHFRSFWV